MLRSKLDWVAPGSRSHEPGPFFLLPCRAFVTLCLASNSAGTGAILELGIRHDASYYGV